MIIMLGGASHTGKTFLAQKLLEKYQYPYISIDHLKMGLIRSRQTSLTVYDDTALTEYLWPILRELIKTAVENKQNLIIEGCYIPFSYQKDFEKDYLRDIKYIALVYSEGYINRNYPDIMRYASIIESRIAEHYPVDTMICDNAATLKGCIENKCDYILFESTDDFTDIINKVLATL